MCAIEDLQKHSYEIPRIAQPKVATVCQPSDKVSIDMINDELYKSAQPSRAEKYDEQCHTNRLLGKDFPVLLALAEKSLY
jgi:hypothetical protein